MSNFRRRLMMAHGGGGVTDLEPCIYTTTSANQNIKIIDKKEYAQRIYLQDGTELDVSGTGPLNYTFPDAGEHKVWIEFKEDITNFSNFFGSCSELTSIPENLFAANTAVTDFSYCFYQCSNLTSIPDNLFANNTAVTTFHQCFMGCSGLTGSIPENLFANNTAVTNFSACFLHCRGLTGSIPENLFANCPNVTTINQCFMGCSGLTGNVPIDNDGTPIYNRSGNGKEGYTIVTYYDLCFYGCTGLTDYNSIPIDWK